MATVLIADDHGLIRNGLRELLEAESVVSDIGEATTGADALKQLEERRWDLIVLDINMPGISGIEVLREVSERFPLTRVLILSGFSEKQYAVNVFRAGAYGYINKEAASDELIAAVRCVLQGRRYVSSSAADLLLRNTTDYEGQPIHSRLSERELQIFLGIAAGKTVSAIAKELHLSVKTASTYRARLLDKLSMTTNAELTTYALRNKLIDPPT